MSNSGSKGNSGNTGGGTETSFTKTPQAKDDNLGTLQTGTLNYVNTVYYLDVMANDLGGKAKSLWSVDDGVNQSGAMSGYEAGDLLTQDGAEVTGSTANRSAFGASLHVTADGRVAYDTSTINPQKAAELTGLALGETMADSFIYAIRMSNGTLSWAKVGVTLTGVNDTPVVQSVTLLATEDGGVVSGQFVGDDVDSDDDGSTLQYAIIGAPGTGSLTNNGNGTFSYDPDNNFQSLAAGEETHVELTYTATDKHGAMSAPATLKITVTGVNDDPTLASGALAATEDGSSVTLDLSALGDDVDSDNTGSDLVYSVSGQPAEGSASISGTTLTFDTEGDFQDLAKDQTRQVVIDVTAKDKHGATATNQVTVTVTGVNDDPTLTAGALAATEDGSAVTLDLSALGDDVDSDDSGSTLTYSLENTPVSGVASISGTTLSFAPVGDAESKGSAPFQSLAAGETTSFDLKVKATDEHGASASNVVTVTVTGKNDDPTLAAGALAASEDGSVVTLDLSALGNDIDSDNDGSNLVYSVSGQPSKGTASISGSTLTYDVGNQFQELAAGQTKNLVVQVTATDKHGASATNNVTITVTGVNDAPIIQNGSDAAGAVTAITPAAPFTVQQYLGYTSTSLNDLRAYASKNAASYTVTTSVIDYTDDPSGFAGEIPGSTPWPASVATGVTGTNETINNNFFARITGQLNVTTADTYTFRTFNDDGVFLTVNNTLVINDPGIHAEQAFTGTLTLTPGVYPIELFFFEVGGEASLEFSYKSSSGNYELVDPNPTLHDKGTIQFSDVDLSDVHSVSVAASGSTLGTLTATKTSDTTGTGTGGKVAWNYAVENNLVRYLGAGDTKVESFTVSVSDGKGGVAQQQVDVTITGINDVAQLGNATVSLTETDLQLFADGTLSISDVDQNEAFFVTQDNTSGKYGTFSIDANGIWQFASNGALDSLTEGQVVTDVFDVTSVDGTATTVTVTITGTADGPTAVDDTNSLTASTVVANTSNEVYWADWQSVEVLGEGVGDAKYARVNGTITLGDGHTIGVSYEGLAWTVILDQGVAAPGLTNYSSSTSEWIEGTPAPYTSSQVNQGPQTWDIIGLSEAFTGGGFQNASNSRTDFSPRNLTFSEPVENLFFAVMSMNLNGYLFDQNFQIVSQGLGKYGQASTITPTDFGDGRYGIVSTGEFHGVLKIDGSVEELTWTSQDKENWNGFTVGTYGQSQSASATGNVLANDVMDNPSSGIEVSAAGGANMVGNSVTLTLASGATLKVDRDGDYFYDDKGKFDSLAAGQTYTEEVEYTVRDIQGYTDTAVLRIVVTGVNNAPVANKDVVSTLEDKSITIYALANDNDADNGDSLSLVSTTQGQKGSVSLSGNTLVYTPNANTNGTDSFSYTIKDAAGATSTGTVDVIITPVPDTYTLKNLVTNGSFENGTTGWTTYEINHVGNWPAADGTKVLDMNAEDGGGYIQQTVQTTLGAMYTLAFAQSRNPEQLAGGRPAPLETLKVTAGTNSQYFSYTGNTQTDMAWAERSVVFGAMGNNTTIRFESTDPLGNGDPYGPALDEVVVVEHRVITDFQKGPGGDVLDLSALLTSINAPASARSSYMNASDEGYVRFSLDNGNTIVRIDADGGADNLITVATLIGVQLAPVDVSNYLL